MLNVCFSGHECGVLNMCSSELEINRKRLVWLDMMLYGGVLTEPLDFAGRKAFYCIDNDYIYTEMRSKLKKFSKMLDDENDISIWYSSTYANDVLGMMWVIHYIRDKKMSVKVYDACKYFDVMLSYDDLPEKPEARILTDDEINDISEKWIRLVNENTGLRILENGEAVSKPVDYFDKDIFDILGSNEKTVCDIYGEMVSGGKTERMLQFLICRIKTLIDENKIELVKMGYIDSDPCFRISTVKAASESKQAIQ